MSAVDDSTEVGSYFISNYPPYSFWKGENTELAEQILSQPPQPDTPLGLYLHIPFCRKRCKFCYFRVYTDKAARDIDTYIDMLAREVELLSKRPAVTGRKLDFAYFGGGTPSYLSVKQLEKLIGRLDGAMPWRDAQEVTFECEPGTLSEPKVYALRDLGVTRLSLGIENFNDQILEENGRAHLSGEIYKSYEWIRAAGFQQVNVDLIAGMVGETWENWQECVQKAIEMSPESVTIYQMELPFNTVYSQTVLQDGDPIPVANWSMKRQWVDYAFKELEQSGYDVSSAYTMVKRGSDVSFRYRDGLWHGADLVATGVASFSHLNGLHYQNVDSWENYIEMLEQNQLPLGRALQPTQNQLLIRELILQLKTGSLKADYFQRKFAVNILAQFHDAFAKWEKERFLTVESDGVTLSRDGLLQADRMLPEFFEAQHRGARYT